MDVNSKQQRRRKSVTFRYQCCLSRSMTEKRKMKLILVIVGASVAAATTTIKCSETEFQCDRARCIPKSWLCDGEPDCSDRTDEQSENCEASATEKTCRATEFQCTNGNCVPKLWKCDGADDCRDNSDEEDCHKRCSDKEFQCVDTQQCIASRWRCDGFNDCSDGSDEVDCTVPTTTVPPNKFKCRSGIIIPSKWVCDGESDCNDGADEKDCSPESLAAKAVTATPRPSICRDNEFQCGSYCILKSWVCDGTEDCASGVDERNCTDCPPHQFQCADKQQCVQQHQRCNMNKDCKDGSDEANCPILTPSSNTTCNATTHFLCKRGQCIEQARLCDGRNNCGDWGDESEEICGIDECERNNGGCTQVCVNTREGHYCTCESGYRLVGKYTCEDINECEEIPGTCSQKCINTRGGFHCTCLPGYKRDPGNYTRCKAASGEPYLFFSHKYDIRSLRLRDRDMTSIVTNAKGANALDYMFRSHEIVWSNNKENEIVRANITTPEIRQVLVSGERVSADGLAVDWIHNNIYYTDTGNFKIRMLSWDARWSKTIVNEELGQPRAIVVSPFDGYVFWTDWGQDPKIERAGLDGANRTAIIREPHVFWPNGITIDHSNNHIYWCDGKLNTISRANLNGSQVEVILFSTSFLRLPYSITVFEDRLYWTDWSQLALYSADKFTGEDVRNISAGHLLESPKVVHVFHEFRQPSGENVCALNRCSHLCIRTPDGTPLCTCPDDMALSLRDSLTCVDHDSPDASYEVPTTEAPEMITGKPPQVPSEPKNPPQVPSEPKNPPQLPSEPKNPPQQPNEAESSQVQPSDIDNSSSQQPTSEESDGYIPTRAEEHKAILPQRPHVGMILGVALGSTVMLGLGVLAFVAWWKSQKSGPKHIRFFNSVYRKTTDEEMDGGGFVIGQEELIYNPSNFHYSEEPETYQREDDNAPLAPKKSNLED